MIRLIAYYDERYVTGRFGDPRPGRTHEGTDFSHSRTPGLTPVPALLDGTVVKVWVVSSFHGYGNRVDTATSHGEVSYAHLYARSSFRVGDRVAQGVTVGHEGMTGFVSGSCCHVEHAVNGRKRDPLPLIRDVLASFAGLTPTDPEGDDMYTDADRKRDVAAADQVRRLHDANFVPDGSGSFWDLQGLTADRALAAQKASETVRDLLLVSNGQGGWWNLISIMLDEVRGDASGVGELSDVGLARIVAEATAEQVRRASSQGAK